MAVIIKNGKTYGDRSVSLTQAEYNALSETEKNNGTVYYIYDVNAVPQASDVVYDNTESGLNASNVQGAIDELNDGLTDINTFPTVANVPVPFGKTDTGEKLYRMVFPFTGVIPINATTLVTSSFPVNSSKVINLDVAVTVGNKKYYGRSLAGIEGNSLYLNQMVTSSSTTYYFIVTYKE